MIDSIQEVSLELTNAIGALHGITVRYAGTANQVLDFILPMIKNLPIVPKNVRDLLINLERWTQKIIDTNAGTARAISDVQSGLQNGDISKLRGHTKELQGVTRSLSTLLGTK
jgi:hypothetical protein